MNSKDIRIGNYILVPEKLPSSGFKHIEVEVDAISYSVLAYQVGDMLSLCEHTETRGIEITEKWLERFGFKDEPKIGWEKKNVYLQFHAVQEHWEVNLTEGIFLRPIKYVHELQNIYFTLTGEELLCSE